MVFIEERLPHDLCSCVWQFVSVTSECVVVVCFLFFFFCLFFFFFVCFFLVIDALCPSKSNDFLCTEFTMLLLIMVFIQKVLINEHVLSWPRKLPIQNFKCNL